jgi:hypothetical protein
MQIPQYGCDSDHAGDSVHSEPPSGVLVRARSGDAVLARILLFREQGSYTRENWPKNEKEEPRMHPEGIADADAPNGHSRRGLSHNLDQIACNTLFHRLDFWISFIRHGESLSYPR